MSDPRPERIGGFSVIEELGQGGMGMVYLARQDSLGRLVALKVLKPELARDATSRERFDREARAAALFQHPHVVAVIDTGHDGDQHYIAFEYIDGGSLEGLVQGGGPLPERRALEVTRAIASALGYAQSKGIVHRDLKPANILIATDGTPKLADLGLARHVDPSTPAVTQEGIILGTPLYMAPEQALGRLIDVRADLYSLGLCLYRMLSGRMPFNEQEDTCSTMTILARHLNEELQDVRAVAKGVSPAVAKLVTDLTTRDPALRYRSASHVVADIDLILAGGAPLGSRVRAAQDEQASDAATTAIRAEAVKTLTAASKDDAPTERLPVQKPPADPERAERARAETRTEPAPAAPPAPAPVAEPPRPVVDENPLRAPIVRPPRPPRGGAAPLVAGAVVLALVGAGLVAADIIPRPGGTSTEVAATGSHATEAPATERATEAPATEPPATERATEAAPTTAPPPVTEAPVTEAPVTEAPVTEAPVTEAPVTERATEAPATESAPDDAAARAVTASAGGPEALALAIRLVGQLLFVDTPAGLDRLERLVEKGGWGDAAEHARWFACMQAVVEAFDAKRLPWADREKRLVALGDKARARVAVPAGAVVARAVDAELQAWSDLAEALLRLRRALLDPRTEEAAIAALAKLPADRRGPHDDARELLLLASHFDQPSRWQRLDERRKDNLALAARLRTRLARSPLGIALGPDLAVALLAFEAQTRDRSASGLAALLGAALELPAEARDSAFFAARVQEVPADRRSTLMPGLGLLVELERPMGPGELVTLTAATAAGDFTIQVAPGAVIIGTTEQVVELGQARHAVVEPGLEGLVVRVPTARPDTFEVAWPARQPALARFSLKAEGVPVARVGVLKVPERRKR